MRRGTPMKYWGFYAPEELKTEAIKCAIAANEDNSEYIRRAVEQRNAQYGKSEIEKILPAQVVMNKKIEDMAIAEPKKEKPTIPELKEEVKEHEHLHNVEVKDNKIQKVEKPRMVQPFMKGGK